MHQSIEVQVCLVSEQAASVLTPLLEQGRRPDSVILLYVAEWLPQVERLEQAIQTIGGIATTRYLLPDMSQPVAIQRALAALLVRLDGRAVALNTSGGNRLLSLLAYEVFRASHQAIFYVDADNHQLHWLYPEPTTPHGLSQRLTLGLYVRAQGWQLVAHTPHDLTGRRYEFAQNLIANMRHYSQALGTLHWLANSAAGGLISKPMEEWHWQDEVLLALLKRLQGLRMLHPRGKQLHFADEAARWFAAGGWLEQYVMLQLRQLQQSVPVIQDCCAGLQLASEHGAQSSVDAALLVRNRLYMIECRTKQLRKGNSRTGAVLVFQPEQMAALATQLQAKSLFISYQALRDTDVRKAKAMGITVLQEQQLQHLGMHLRDWVNV